MSKKKKLIDITQYCFLSGEPIIRLKDLTKEHYCPKSKLPPSIANDPYNIKPALKVIYFLVNGKNKKQKEFITQLEIIMLIDMKEHY